MGFNILNIVHPLVGYVPSVKKPEKKLTFQERLTWTMVALCIFLFYSQIPLFGIMSSEGADLFYWMRAILASNRGTLMDLGITPIVTIGMVMQCLVGAGLLSVDNNVKEDRIKYNALNKILVIIMTIGQAIVQVKNNFYGSASDLGPTICILLVLQLTFSGVILLLLDEMLEIGYGLGSGTSLFIATNICETIFWKSFSPTTHITGRGVEFEGAILSFFHLLFTRKNKIRALKEAMYRPRLTNLTNIFATALIFAVVIYLHGFRREVPVVGVKGRSYSSTYKVKLFYASTMPIMIFSALVSNVFFVSLMLFRNYPENFFIKLLGSWEPTTYGNFKAISGIAYYITPPHSFVDVYRDPIHFVVYLVFILSTCAITSKLWIEVSGSSPKDVIQSFKEQGITIKGYREGTMEDIITQIITTSAIVGGILIGLLSISADLMGAIGSGSGILMTVTIIYGYTEIYGREAMENKNLKALIM